MYAIDSSVPILASFVTGDLDLGQDEDVYDPGDSYVILFLSERSHTN